MTSLTATSVNRSTPAWVKIVAVIGIVWYAFGLIQFWIGYSMDTALAVENGAITAAHADAINGTPLLVWLAFALASSAGLVGAFFLLVGSVRTTAAFALSLASAALYYAWIYGLSGTGSSRPPEELIVAAVVVGVTLAFFLLSRRIT